MHAYKEVVEPQKDENPHEHKWAFYCPECNTIKIGEPLGLQLVYDLRNLNIVGYEDYLQTSKVDIPRVFKHMCWLSPDDEVCYLDEDKFERDTYGNLHRKYPYATGHDEEGDEIYDGDEGVKTYWICGDCEQKYSVDHMGLDRAELAAVRCCRTVA